MARPEKGFQFFRRRGIMGLPHKGTETRCRPRLYLTTGFQLIPARGRKPINDPVFASQAVISTYPRKGTETSAISLDGEWMPISTYPRKGTETGRVLHRIHSTGFQLIPARGRKLYSFSFFTCIIYFNSSPQGDGNAADFLLKPNIIISTYPRKGTETVTVVVFLRHIFDFNLSPQGDGNSILSTVVSPIHIFQLIPARGRKRLMLASIVRSITFQLIPARGQKTPHQKWCGVFLLRALTFRFPWAIPL